jgi:tRNA (guanosine-2'-O-)-methyltransferase
MRRTTPGLLSLTPSRTALGWPVEVIEAALEPLILPERIARFDAVARARLSSVVTVLECIVDPHNMAAMLRTCDALGVGEVHLIEDGLKPLVTQSVSRGCERWLDLHMHRDPAVCVHALRERGYEVYVADARGTLTLDEVAARSRVAMVFANEHQGASPALRALAHGAFSVPMRGMVESFNVSVAAGIALHTVTRARPGDLGDDEARCLRARFLIESVDRYPAVIERYLRDQAVKS